MLGACRLTENQTNFGGSGRLIYMVTWHALRVGT
jgi:hypothetical protein